MKCWKEKHRGTEDTEKSTVISSVISVPLCFKSSRDDEIAERGSVLTPGRYVGAEELEDDGGPFAEKMEGLTREFATQFHESKRLRAAIRDNI